MPSSEYFRQARTDDRFGLRADGVKQPFPGGNVMDHTLYLSRPENACSQITCLQHDASLCTRYELCDILKRCPWLPESAYYFFRYRALANARGIVEFTEDQIGPAFIIVDIGLLHVVMNRCFDRGAETRAHIDAVRAERQRRH